MRSTTSYITNISVTLLLVAASAFIVYENKITVMRNLVAIKEYFLPTPPCTVPITYALGRFDTMFGLPKKDFLGIVDTAAASWSEARGNKLFASTTDPKRADVIINLIYDHRQETTNQLDIIGDAIENHKEDYDDIQADYGKLLADYKKAKAAFDARQAQFEGLRGQYETQVAYWNDRGGAPREEYVRLDQLRKNLNAEAEIINKEANRLNAAIRQLNSLGAEQNQVARELNQTVRTYNTVGATVGEEFSEGEYVVDAEGTRINIYQYSNLSELLRVLKHEFGHALAIDHANDPDAIMYHLNESINQDFTQSDLSLLAQACTEK